MKDAFVRTQPLSEVETRFRLMADHAPVLLWMAGTDGLCHFFNQGWLAFTGRTLAEELGNGWAEGVHPEDFQRCMATYLDAFVEKRTFAMEYRLRRHDGEFRWIYDQGTPRFETNGSFAGYIGSCIDVTEQRKAQDVLRRRNQDLEDLVHERTELAEKRMVLLREVHHRVKNDLQLISSLLSMQGRRLSDAEAVAALEDCQSRVQAVAQIHEEVYRTEHFESMEFSASVRSLVTGVFSMSPQRAGAVSLQVDVEDEILLTIERAIPSGLILRELVTNALKHAFPDGRKGTLSVRVRKHGARHVVMEVADDGVGPPSPASERGHSLGWKLVLAFARQLSAAVSVTHEQGTTVRVTFPLHPDDSRSTETRSLYVEPSNGSP